MNLQIRREVHTEAGDLESLVELFRNLEFQRPWLSWNFLYRPGWPQTH